MNETPVKVPVDRRMPVDRRFPVLNEDLAEKMKNGCASEGEKDAFYHCINKLAYNVAKRYHKKTIHRTDWDDMTQECFRNLMQRLSTYDSRKAKFTTWAYYVFMSAMNKVYHDEGTYRDNNHVEVDESISKSDDDMGMRVQMRMTIQKLFDAHPYHRKILLAMFGDPSVEDYRCPDSICCTKIANELGMDYEDVHGFYVREVCPVFAESFRIS